MRWPTGRDVTLEGGKLQPFVDADAVRNGKSDFFFHGKEKTFRRRGTRERQSCEVKSSVAQEKDATATVVYLYYYQVSNVPTCT